jgi:hypothetical protein
MLYKLNLINNDKHAKLAKNFLKFNVGDCSNISLWNDNWHPNGILFNKYGFRVIHDSF